MERIRNLVFLMVTLLCVTTTAYAQDNRPMHEYHSMLVYNFIKYIEWPATEKSGDFLIGVLGDDKVYQTLNKWYGSKSKGSQKMVIKKFSSVDDMPKCHVIYISKGKSNYFEGVKSRMAGLPVLIITDKAGLGKKGSNINFKMVDNKLKFELNKETTSEANLKVATQLLKMAILIE